PTRVEAEEVHAHRDDRECRDQAVERLLRHNDLGYGRRKSAPQTSTAPRWPATPTSAAAENSAARYTHVRRGDGRLMTRPVVHAAALANTTAPEPNQRCH